MRRLKNSYGKLGIITAMVLMVVLATLLPACHRKPVSHHADNPRYLQLDSMMRAVRDADSLSAIAARFHQEGESMGEMLALKHEGRQLLRNGRMADALKVGQRCLDIATSLNDTVEAMNMLNIMGESSRRLGELNTANGYLYNALKLNDAYSDNRSDEAIWARSTTLNGIANIEMAFSNYSTADSVLKEALQYVVKLNRNMGLAINYGDLGRVKRAQGQMDSAWYYCRKSMECNRLNDSGKGVAVAHMNFGGLYEDERRFSYAVDEYQQAYDQLKETGDSWFWIESCLSLARVKLLLGEREDAHAYLTEAENEAARIGCKEYQIKASKIHYALSLLNGNSDEALKHYVRADELFDSICGQEKNDEMRLQRFDYQNGRRIGEMDVLNRDLSHMKRMRNMQIAFTLLLILMLGAIIAALAYAMRVRGTTQQLMRQVEETRSLFFTNVVHRLRTPLTVIMGAIDALLADMPADSSNNGASKQRVRFEMIERQGKNLLELVDRILAVGSVRSALKEPDWKRGDVVALIRMVLESYRERCVERHIELTYVPCESHAEIDTVPHYLVTIIGSIIENAINYISDFSKITVTSRIHNNVLTLRIADNGMGISKNDLPHVFEPFFRGAAAEQKYEGMGIGLTIVRDMTMAMGGRVAVDSMKDQGSVFTVELPCKHQGDVKERFDNAIEPIVRKVRTVVRQEVIEPSTGDNSDDRPVALVIEDHSDVAMLVGAVLEQRFAVYYASDGDQGLVKARELVPDLIVTDVKMPVMDGYELCREVRGSSELSHIPIIVLSARTSEADRIKGIEAGADAYLVKPFSDEELRAWADNLMRREKVARTSSPVEDESEAEDEQPMADNAMSDSQFLKEFATLVEEGSENGNMKLNLDQIALHFKMGESQLKHKIQKLTGKNIIAFITQLRMEKAMRLLQTSPDMLIGDVANECGFADMAYFSRVFRNHYGMTPSQARTGAAGTAES